LAQLPWEAVESPSLEVFKKYTDMALRDVGWWGWVVLNELRGFSQPL